MAIVHTESAAIFGGLFVNQAEDKIQFVKHRPSQPWDSKQPIPFKIPGNSNQYVSLHDSYLYVQCHVEMTDAYGQPLEEDEVENEESSGTGSRRRRATTRHGEEEYPRPNGKRSRRTTEEEDEEETLKEEVKAMDEHVEDELEQKHIPPKKKDLPGDTSAIKWDEILLDNVYTSDEIKHLEVLAIQRHIAAVRSKKRAVEALNTPEYDKKMKYAAKVQDIADTASRQYLNALLANRITQSPEGAVVPVDNVMHSMWSGVDIFMNGEQVSTTNQKYMYKAYMETVLNNGYATKKYQLKSSGFYGDEGNRDEHFYLSHNSGMLKRAILFNSGKRVEMLGFILSDIMGIQASIVNGVEIEIVLTPNLDNLRLQSFGPGKYGRLIIDDICLYVCKRTFSKEVILAHASLMEEKPAIYPFKKTEVRAYNGNEGNTQVIIENPYESKIPTRFILGMIDADAYIGNWEKNPLNFQHYDISRAAFFIDDETIAKPPYLLNPTQGQYLEPLMELYHILGKAGEDQDIGISPEEYINGLFLLPFDVTPTSAANMEYLSKKKEGNCRIELQFRKPLPNNIIILAYAIFPMELRIDGARNCATFPV